MKGLYFMMNFSELFDRNHSLAASYLSSFPYPWEALATLGDKITEFGKTLSPAEYDEVTPCVWVHKCAIIAPSAEILAPAIIGAKTEVRHGAFIRGAVLVGEGCVIGNSTEVKNSILFDCVQVPHFNYVGDSILGYRAHFGAGVITANVRLDHGEVVVHGEAPIATSRKKCGAMIGDRAEIGCNSVLCPGAVIGRGTMIYPLSVVRGVVGENCIMRAGDILTLKGE